MPSDSFGPCYSSSKLIIELRDKTLMHNAMVARLANLIAQNAISCTSISANSKSVAIEPIIIARISLRYFMIDSV